MTRSWSIVAIGIGAVAVLITIMLLIPLWDVADDAGATPRGTTTPGATGQPGTMPATESGHRSGDNANP